jgi:hypothetical protein
MTPSMAAHSRFSTATVVDSKYLVPWLAAQGPLAYSPIEPPARDYFFQYSWILPGIFDPKVNLREHRYFGRYHKDSSKFLFDFWDSARRGGAAAQQQYCEPGLFSDLEVKTPLAVYRQVRKYYNTAGSLLIQHGSYQWISREDQPRIEQGQILLYRGIGQSPVFRCLQFEPSDLTAANREILRRYLGIQAEMLSDSVLSFNTIHDRVKRSETEGLRHGTWLGAQQYPSHHLLRGRVRGENSRSQPGLPGRGRRLPGGIRPSHEIVNRIILEVLC